MRTQGHIERVSDDGKVIWVNGERYSAFSSGMITAKPGDYVDFEYTEKNGVNRTTGAPVVYKNIRGRVAPAGSVVPMPMGIGTATMVPVSVPKPPPGTPEIARERTIIRQNAASTAAKIVDEYLGFQPPELSPPWAHNFSEYIDMVIEVAKKVEAYTSGDMDVDEVKKLIAEE